ncbi:DUF1127 domain-containing protein [Rhizobium sp. LEGMi198b]
MTIVERVRHYIALRRAIRELSSQDDHCLSDIGIDRKEIGTSVRRR